MSVPRQLVSIIDIDPELSAGLDDESLALARRHLAAQPVLLPTGPFEFPAPNGDQAPPALGLYLIDGLIARDVELAGRSTTELLGAGDVIRPWDDGFSIDGLPGTVGWWVIEPARVVLLDRRFAAVAGRWPHILDAIVQRTMRRSRALSVQRAIAQVPRVDTRVMVLMWLLAERWGKVGTEGVRLPLALTHETIAKLVGARRPSVTTALGVLARKKLVERIPDGWLLHGDSGDAWAQLG
ncbi:MAG TPA: Crp/Fnr family transcriptional regulator [Baekduia sp.]|nr:Crp/Fnr family transcriptional regulator [Baekduia sp.]